MKKPNLSRTLHRGLAMILAFALLAWYAACGGAGGACQLRWRAGYFRPGEWDGAAFAGYA